MPTKKVTTENKEVKETVKKPKKTLARADRPTATKVLEVETTVSKKHHKTKNTKFQQGSIIMQTEKEKLLLQELDYTKETDLYS